MLARDRAFQCVHRREECRTRTEALMREDGGFRRHVESTCIRLTLRLADVLEWSHVKEQKSEAERKEISNKVINQKCQNKLKVVQIQETWEHLSPRTTSWVQRATGRLWMWKGQGHQKLECVFNVEKDETEFDVCDIFSDFVCARWQKIWEGHAHQ